MVKTISYQWTLSFFLAFACSVICAQKTYRFESITVDNGLSQSGVTSIAQDELGYLWVGTQDGLNRYDGYSIKVYRNKQGDIKSLSKNYVTEIFVDKSKTIWIATLGNLSQYDPATDGFVNYPLAVTSVPIKADSYIWSIRESRDGALVLATSNGLIHFDRSTHTFSIRNEYKHFFGSTVYNYVESKGIGDWVIMLDSSFQQLPGEHAWKKNLLPGVGSFYDKRKDQLYFYSDSIISDTSSAIIKYDTSGKWLNWMSFPYHFSNSLEMCFLQNGDIWVASDYGISIYDSAGDVRGSITAYEIAASPINYLKALYESREGVVWLGTNGYGLKKYNPQTNQFNYAGTSTASSLSLRHNYVDAIFTSNDTTVYVTTPDGLDILDVYKKTSTHLQLPERFSGITQDTKGQLWFSNNDGLWLFKNGAFIDAKIHHIDTSNFFPSSRLVLHSQGKVILMDKGNKETLFDIGSTANINTAKLIGDSLWIGLGDGPSQLRLFNIQTRPYINALSDSSEDATNTPGGGGIKCIFQDSQKRIWIGSNGNGLSLYHPKENTFTHFTEKDGLPNNTVYGILEDANHNLWLSTNKGLCEYNPQTKKVRNFEALDGLQSNEFNTGAYFKSKRGIMYFGGVNGLTYFDPQTIETVSTQPRSVISGYYVNSKLLSDYSSYVQKSEGKLTFNLKYNESDFGFDFVGVGFSLPGRTKYRYILQNYDKEWHDIGNIPHINFTNIPPGEYVFRVKSSDPYGNWESNGAAITVVIHSPLWLNPAVWILAVIGSVAITLVIYLERMRQLKIRAQLLARIVDERTQEIQLQKIQIIAQNGGLLEQALVLEEKNKELEKAKDLLEIEVKYLHQRQLLKTTIGVQEDERKRIAQDLHDELGAVLSIARMHLVQIQEQKDSGLDLTTALHQARTLTESALATMRRISHELMPPQLEKFGLIKTLQAIVTQTITAKQIELQLIAGDDLPRWPMTIELGLYRVCMEMINNTIKHAGAKNITIQLKQHSDQIVFLYTDDGKGLPENYVEGHGFKNIEARVDSMGGVLIMKDKNQNGFQASLTIHMSRFSMTQ